MTEEQKAAKRKEKRENISLWISLTALAVSGIAILNSNHQAGKLRTVTLCDRLRNDAAAIASHKDQPAFEDFWVLQNGLKSRFSSKVQTVMDEAVPNCLGDQHIALGRDINDPKTATCNAKLLPWSEDIAQACDASEDR